MMMKVREDFRRDGLAANFLADEKMMYIVTKVLFNSKINIGYPAICDEEYRMCERILEIKPENNNEYCVVGHSRKDHLLKLAKIINNLMTKLRKFKWFP